MPNVNSKPSFTLLYIILITGQLILIGCAPKNDIARYTGTADVTQNTTVSVLSISPTLLKTWQMPNVSDIAWSPKSNLFAIEAINQNDRSIIELYDANTYQIVWSKDSIASGLTFSPDGKIIAETSRLQGLIQFRNAEDGRILKNMTAGNCSGGNIILFNSDGSKLIVGNLALPGSQSSNVNLWDVSSGQCEELLSAAGHLTLIDVNPNGNLMALGSFFNENLTSVWDIENQKELCSIKGSFGLFVPDTDILAVSMNDILRFIDPYTCITKQEYSIDAPYLGYMDFSNNGNLLAIVGKYLQIYETSTGKLLTQENLSDGVDQSSSNTRLAFSSDGRYLLTMFSMQIDNKYQDVIQLWQVGE